MRVYINGEAHEVLEPLALAQLIEQLALAPERLAVELNREVVRRERWAQTALAEGDRIEIVHFVGGGAHEPTTRRSRHVSSGENLLPEFGV